MVLNSLKKILLFSSVKSKKLIETMADDESTCTKIKSSAILESRLVDSFLTENDQIRFWILNLYNGDTSGKILSSVFAYNSSGINWKSKGLPVLPFIEFAINEQKYINKYKADKEPMEHFLDCLDSIKRILEKMKENSLDVESKIKYREALKIIDFFTIQLNDENEKIPFGLIYHFFKDYWDDLKDSTHTFRALRDLAAMQKGWRNSKESRYVLTKCLHNLEEYMSE